MYHSTYHPTTHSIYQLTRLSLINELYLTISSRYSSTSLPCSLNNSFRRSSNTSLSRCSASLAFWRFAWDSRRCARSSRSSTMRDVIWVPSWRSWSSLSWSSFRCCWSCWRAWRGLGGAWAVGSVRDGEGAWCAWRGWRVLYYLININKK